MTDILITARRDQVGDVIGALSPEDMGRVDGLCSSSSASQADACRLRRRLPRRCPEAAAPLPVRIYRRRLLRRGDAAAQRRRPGEARAAPAGAARRSALDLSTNCSARSLPLPVALGPIGLAGMNARRGEVRRRGRPRRRACRSCLSTVGCCRSRKSRPARRGRSGSSST